MFWLYCTTKTLNIFTSIKTKAFFFLISCLGKENKSKSLLKLKHWAEALANIFRMTGQTSGRGLPWGAEKTDTISGFSDLAF